MGISVIKCRRDYRSKIAFQQLLISRSTVRSRDGPPIKTRTYGFPPQVLFIFGTILGQFEKGVVTKEEVLKRIEEVL